MGLQSHMVALFLVSYGTSILFSIVLASLLIKAARKKHFSFTL